MIIGSFNDFLNEIRFLLLDLEGNISQNPDSSQLAEKVGVTLIV